MATKRTICNIKDNCVGEAGHKQYRNYGFTLHVLSVLSCNTTTNHKSSLVLMVNQCNSLLSITVITETLTQISDKRILHLEAISSYLTHAFSKCRLISRAERMVMLHVSLITLRYKTATTGSTCLCVPPPPPPFKNRANICMIIQNQKF
jgi:hypothetical protein